MVLVELEEETFQTVIASQYCMYHDVDVLAIPREVYAEISQKLQFFMSNWDFSKISLEEFIRTKILIYPTMALDEETLEDIKNNTLYWEKMNGNVLLSISMDIRLINGED